MLSSIKFATFVPLLLAARLLPLAAGVVFGDYCDYPGDWYVICSYSHAQTMLISLLFGYAVVCAGLAVPQTTRSRSDVPETCPLLT